MALRLGTRNSPLARWQANWVADRLRQAGADVAIVGVTTHGDVHSGPLGAIGGQGLFTKELQRSLLSEEIDLAVHSLKDLPTETVDGLTLGAIPTRETTHDVLVTVAGDTLATLPARARVGTGSTRRRAQLLFHRPDLVVEEIRGNVDTRLAKLDRGEYQAIVLAEAGLTRLGLRERVTQVLPRNTMLPAVGQGALGIEIRQTDESTRAWVAKLDDVWARAEVEAERALLATLRGGCLAPVGASGRVEGAGEKLVLDACVLDLSGRERICCTASGAIGGAIALGESVARLLLAQGAGELIIASRAM